MMPAGGLVGRNSIMSRPDNVELAGKEPMEKDSADMEVQSLHLQPLLTMLWN